MVWRQRASLPDALPSLDRRVAERLDRGVACSAASALDFWGEHPSINRHGDFRANPQFRVLALVVRGRVVGARSDR